MTTEASGGPGEALPLLATTPLKGFALKKPFEPAKTRIQTASLLATGIRVSFV